MHQQGGPDGAGAHGVAHGGDQRCPALGVHGGHRHARRTGEVVQGRQVFQGGGDGLLRHHRQPAFEGGADEGGDQV